VTEQTSVTDTTDIALAAAISGPQTNGGKTASAKSAPQAQVKTQAASDSTTSPDPAKTAATIAVGLNGTGNQPVAGAKPDAAPLAASAAKPDVSSATAAATTDTVISRDHGSANSGAPTSPANTDASLQIPTTFQPQAPSTAPTLSAANLTATAATGAPVPLSGLAVEIAASAHSGKTRFDVRLDPADLGRIDVRIDVDRNGQVTSHLRVEKPETLSMLQQDAPQLRQALDDAGLKTGTGGLQFSLRDQSSSGQNNGNQTGGNAQRLVVSEEDTVPVAVAGRSYGRMLTSNGGVDIRV
jgi:flagellar hook-length control protein FliK